VQCPGERNVAVRMRQIDAPELEQSYGEQARNRLRKLCPRGSRVTLHRAGRDQYGRLLADVQCGSTDVNSEMVSQGAAWPYRRYVEDVRLLRLQKEARANGRGLWAEPAPQPPWQWRYENRMP